MAVFGQSGDIWTKWLYSDKSGCIRAKEVVLVQKWFNSGKVVVFGQKLLYLGKSG